MRYLIVHELRSRVGAILGWGIGLAAFAALYVRIYPEIEAQGRGEGGFSIYRAVGVDLASFDGFVASTVIQFMPLMLGVYAIVTGTDTLAGEEDRGTLELVVVMPIARPRIVAAKALALSVVIGLILIIAGAGGAAMHGTMGLPAPPSSGLVFLAILTPWPLVMAFAMMSASLGAILSSRRSALLASTVVFVASFFVERLVRLVDSPELLGRLSLFHYFDSGASLFAEGVRVGDMLLLLGVAFAFFGLTMIAFQRRNVSAGALAWPSSAKRLGR